MTSRIFPGVAYEDAAVAMDWLCEALGFEKHFVVRAPNGSIPHAVLRHGENMIMLGTTGKEGGLGIKQPREAGGVTQTVYFYLGDDKSVRRHYEQAIAHGATIVRELGPTDYGSVEYVCADPEGHYWCFGSYVPPDEPQEMHL